MSYENILKLLDKLPEDQADQKSELRKLVQDLNQEKGKASADILKIKDQLKSLQGQNEDIKAQAANYKDITGELSKLGVDAKNAEELLKKLNITKSVEDENATLKELLSQKDEKLHGFETQQQINARKEKVNPLFEKALGEFVEAQRKDGKPNYNLTDTFVDKETLYKEVDIENDTLRNDHFTKVLQAADSSQQKFMESTGMDYAKQVHRQGMTQGHYTDKTGINEVASEATKKVRESQGSFDSVIHGIAQLHAAQKEKS